MKNRNGNIAVTEAEFEAAEHGGIDPVPPLANYRAAVAHLAGWARQNPHCSTGQQMRTVMASLAFGGSMNAVDIGTISWSWGQVHLSALLTVVAGRRRHGWPTDIIPDQELQSWVDGSREDVHETMTL